MSSVNKVSKEKLAFEGVYFVRRGMRSWCSCVGESKLSQVWFDVGKNRLQGGCTFAQC